MQGRPCTHKVFDEIVLSDSRSIPIVDVLGRLCESVIDHGISDGLARCKRKHPTFENFKPLHTLWLHRRHSTFYRSGLFTPSSEPPKRTY